MESTDTETMPGIGHNHEPAADQATFLQLVREHDAIDSDIAALRADRKTIRGRVKGAGFSLAEFDLARKLGELSHVERETFDGNLRRNMLWLGKPLGTQGDLFNSLVEPDPNGLDRDQAAVGEHQVHQVRSAGQSAGAGGNDRLSNPWTAGSFLYQVWDEGWMQGQEKLAQTLVGPETVATEPAKRRGRPKGSKNRPAS